MKLDEKMKKLNLPSSRTLEEDTKKKVKINLIKYNSRKMN